jgi:hypothetical protein
LLFCFFRNDDYLAAFRVQAAKELLCVDPRAYATIICEGWHGDLWETYVKTLNQAARSSPVGDEHPRYAQRTTMWKDVQDGSNSTRCWCFTTFSPVYQLFRMTELVLHGSSGGPGYRSMRIVSPRGTIAMAAPPLHVKLQRIGDKTKHGYCQRLTIGFTIWVIPTEGGEPHHAETLMVDVSITPAGGALHVCPVTWPILPLILTMLLTFVKRYTSSLCFYPIVPCCHLCLCLMKCLVDLTMRCS